MALIKCPECGKEISDKATNCVNCGYPLENIDLTDKSDNNPSSNEILEETKFFTVCYKCGSFHFTYKTRIDNTTASVGYPTCMNCGGKIKILAGKNEWMSMDKVKREEIAEEEIIKVKGNPEYDIQMATSWGKNPIRPDLNFQGYCPKCAKHYSKRDTVRKGITVCEFCGTQIKYSNMLSEDFADLFEQEKERLGIDIPRDDKPISNLIRKTFLLDNTDFDEVVYNKRLHPEQYSTHTSPTVNIPKCPTCGSEKINKISGLSKAGSVAFWGIFSRKVHKQWHCNNCGSEW